MTPSSGFKDTLQASKSKAVTQIVAMLFSTILQQQLAELVDSDFFFIHNRNESKDLERTSQSIFDVLARDDVECLTFLVCNDQSDLISFTFFLMEMLVKRHHQV